MFLVIDKPINEIPCIKHPIVNITLAPFWSMILPIKGATSPPIRVPRLIAPEINPLLQPNSSVTGLTKRLVIETPAVPLANMIKHAAKNSHQP